MSSARKKTGKKSKPQAKTTAESMSPRRLAPPRRTIRKPRTWRKKKNSTARAPLPKASQLFRTSILNMRESGKTLAGITTIYAVGVLLFVRGFSGASDFASLNTILNSLFTGVGGKVQSALIQLSALFSGSNTSSTANGSLYQTMLLLICSLAIIWVFRQKQAKQDVSTKAAFYRGMYPLVPFVLVVIIIGIQLLPLSIGSYMYANLIGGGIAINGAEKLATLIVFFGLAIWSLRMITGSIFALYIVTLPDMYPLQAIRSAKQLVAGRRLFIWRKLLLIPIGIVVCTSLVVLPFLFVLSPLAVWVFFIVSAAWLPFVHSYLYTLYRELLA